MTGGVLARYFGLRFLSAVVIVFAGILSLAALIDYVELTRRASDIPGVSALLIAKTALYRIPLLTEKLMPFCVLIGAMSCYLNLSRRLELVIARSAGLVSSPPLRNAGWARGCGFPHRTGACPRAHSRACGT